MSGPMCGLALDPRPKSKKSMWVPESVEETQPPEKDWGARVKCVSHMLPPAQSARNTRTNEGFGTDNAPHP